MPSQIAAAATSSKTSSSSSFTGSAHVAVWHSEETRLQALQCVHSLFLCVGQLLDLSGSCSGSTASAVALQAAPLVSTFQRDASFCVSLGYYIHLLLRFATPRGLERNRRIRAKALESLSTVTSLLQSPALNQPLAKDAPAAVPGRMLMLSYFPGIMSALFNLLIFDDVGSARSGGWRLQLQAFLLFAQATKAAVRQVAAVDDIVREATADKRNGNQRTIQEDEEMIAQDAHSAAADDALAKLSALVPKPVTSTSSSRSASSSASSSLHPLQLSQLHPMLQSILKPVDLVWWGEARGNIANIIGRVFASTQLTSHPVIAKDMLAATEEFLLGDSGADAALEDAKLSPALFVNGNTIYTSLLPSSCVLAWMEFVILCNEHEDPALRQQARAIVERIGRKTGGAGWARQHAHQSIIGGSGLPAIAASSSSSALVPLLTSSLSSHLLRLPRMLPTASESGQVALLKTIKGYIDVLGRSSDSSIFSASAASAGAWGAAVTQPNVLYDFMAGDMDRVLKIFYKIFEVESSKESKVLDRVESESSSDSSTATTALMTPRTSVEAAPTYYAFSFTHMHTASAHALSLSVLRSLGYFLASHFGLFLAHLHDRLQSGMREVSPERRNYSASNQLLETVLFINTAMLGLGDALRERRVSPFEVVPHLEILLLDYLHPTLWHLPLANARAMAASHSARLSHAELSRNSLIVSFLVRGVGDMAFALREDFRPLLMHVLYPLLEKLGSNQSTQVRQAALVTLHRVAHECGYANDAMREGLPPTPDQTLQAMLVDNMDYLVEQMAVELRTLNLNNNNNNANNLQATTPSSSAAHPLTLPLVLSSLLTRISLSCTQALIPLLDDILSVVLDKLGEMSLQADYSDNGGGGGGGDEEHEAMGSESEVVGGGGVSASMGRLAYLEILRSVVTAIHLIQDNQDKLSNPTLVLPELYASAAPLPQINAAAAPASTTALLKETSSDAVAEFDPDSMLNFEADQVLQEEKVAEVPSIETRAAKTEEKKMASPVAAPKPAEPYFAPRSIRERIQAALIAKRELADNSRFESEWLRRGGAEQSGGATIEEEKEGDGNDAEMKDVPRDAEGRTSAERWYEEQQAIRAKREAKKFNTINGVEDPMAQLLGEDEEAEMEREAEAHKDPPEVPLTPDQATTLRIFQQCRNFLSTASGTGRNGLQARLAQQYTVLCIVAECIPVLARVPKQFFPEVAKFWPSLQQALRLMDNSAQLQLQTPMQAQGGKVQQLLKNEGAAGGSFVNSLTADATGGAMQSLTSVRVSAEQSGSSSNDQQLSALISSLTTSAASQHGGGGGGGGGMSATASSSFSHSTASPLFIQSLGVLSQLSVCASKFLAGRFAQEIWPMLQHILVFEHRWMRELASYSRQQRTKKSSSASGSTTSAAMTAAEDAALQLLPAYKVQLALLTTLSHLVRFPDLSSQHVISLSERVCPYLSSEQPPAFQALAVRIMEPLLQLDADAVWATLWQLCPRTTTRAQEQRRQARGRSDAAAAATGQAQAGSFLSHPCFQQVYPNFDARFLLHQRSMPMQQASQVVGAEFEQNVQRLLDSLKKIRLPDPKLLM